VLEKPVAPACERNQQHILDVLSTVVLDTDRTLLEVGSGTGQHAVFMAAKLAQIQWHTSDLLENHRGINMWLDDAGLENLHGPHIYQSGETDLIDVEADIVFTTNTFHIMAWEQVENLIRQCGALLKSGARVLIYGPFNYNGQFTSDSNAKFDLWLKAEGAHRGIRHFEEVEQKMNLAGLHLMKDVEMPSNNRILVFKKLK